jgi:hypothetical protein
VDLFVRADSDSGQTNVILGSSPFCAAVPSHSDAITQRQIVAPAFIASFKTNELSASRRNGLKSNIGALVIVDSRHIATW